MDKLQKFAAKKMIEDMANAGEKLDAMTAARKFAQEFDVRIDWHEFSYLLDQLHTQGSLSITQPGGMTQYGPAR